MRVRGTVRFAVRPATRNLLLVLLLAFGLRLVALAERSLWYDEAFAVLFSEKGIGAMLYGTLTPVEGVAADVHPLLYYGLLGQWMSLFGEAAGAIRLFSVLLGVATILVLYALARDLFGERTGLVSALIAAVAPFHVQYSQEARMYALLGLLLTSAAWCFVRGWRSGKPGWWIGFGVLAGLSMYAQQLAAFMLLALGLAPILARRRDQFIRVALAAVLAGLIYLPWLVNLPAQLGKVGNYWIQRPSPLQPLVTLWNFIFAELPVTAQTTILIGLTTFTLLMILLVIGLAEALRRRSGELNRLAFVLGLVAGPIALMWLVSQWRPVYLTRGLLPSALMLYIALGWLFTRARVPTPIRAVTVPLLAATFAIGLISHYRWDTFPRPPFEAAVRHIKLDWQPADRVVHANKLTMLPMVYYDRMLTQAYIRDVPGSGEDTLARPTQEALGLLADDCVASAAGGAARVWFVIFQEQVAQSGGESADLMWLEAHYRRRNSQAFNDLLVYQYDQPDETARRAACEGK